MFEESYIINAKSSSYRWSPGLYAYGDIGANHVVNGLSMLRCTLPCCFVSSIIIHF